MVRPLDAHDSSLLGGDRHKDEPFENRCAPFYERGWRAGYAAARAAPAIDVERLRADIKALECVHLGTATEWITRSEVLALIPNPSE